MPHQMLKFRIDNFVFDLRRQAHAEGRKYGWIDWSFHQWERVSGWLLLLGGFLLIIGSVLFLPECGPDANRAGSYVFVGSSLCYMITSTHDFLEIVAAALWANASNAANAATKDESTASSVTANNKINWMEWYSAITFLFGATLFMVGTASGLLSPMMMDSMDPFLPTAWSFILGSCCCLTGSIVNAMQIWDAPDRKSAMYANMIAIMYIIGSSFYLCGSMPYLYFFHHHQDMTNISRIVAIFFIMGSVLFLMGAILNLYRVEWNEKYDPEVNWFVANNNNDINKVNSRKTKRVSSDLEKLVPTNLKARPSEAWTRTSTVATDDTGDVESLQSAEQQPLQQHSTVKRTSSEDRSRRRRASSQKAHNAPSSLDVSGGMWT